MANDKTTQQVTLGCGTLLLIGLVVALFVRPGMSTLEGDVKALRSEVGELKKMIEARTSQIQALQKKLGPEAEARNKD